MSVIRLILIIVFTTVIATGLSCLFEKEMEKHDKDSE